MSSFKDEEFDFEWPRTMDPLTQALNTRKSLVSTTKSFVSTTVEAILMGKSKESSSESPDYKTSTESSIATMLNSGGNITEFSTTFSTAGNAITEVPQDVSYLKSTYDTIGGLLERAAATSETPIASSTSDLLTDMFKNIVTSQKPDLGLVNIKEPMQFDGVTKFDNIQKLLTNMPNEDSETYFIEMHTNTTSSVNTIRDWLADTSTEKTFHTTLENAFSTIENIITDATTETPFLTTAGRTEEPFVNINTTTTVSTIKDWISQTSEGKNIYASHSESPTFANTLKSTLENSFTEIFKGTEEQFQLSANKTADNFSESPISTMKTLLEDLNKETPFESTNETDLIRDIYTTITTTKSSVSDVENIQDMQKTSYDWGETTNFTTAGETVTEFFSTVSSNSNITTGETKESSSLLDSNKDIVIYIVIGVILICLILLFIGIYLCCKRCKKGHEIKGEYYVSQLKDYSDSSGKSTETVSDTMDNIKL